MAKKKSKAASTSRLDKSRGNVATRVQKKKRKFDKHAPSQKRLRELAAKSVVPEYLKVDEDF